MATPPNIPQTVTLLERVFPGYQVFPPNPEGSDDRARKYFRIPVANIQERNKMDASLDRIRCNRIGYEGMPTAMIGWCHSFLDPASGQLALYLDKDMALEPAFQKAAQSQAIMNDLHYAVYGETEMARANRASQHGNFANTHHNAENIEKRLGLLDEETASNALSSRPPGPRGRKM